MNGSVKVGEKRKFREMYGDKLPGTLARQKHEKSKEDSEEQLEADRGINLKTSNGAKRMQDGKGGGLREPLGSAYVTFTANAGAKRKTNTVPETDEQPHTADQMFVNDKRQPRNGRNTTQVAFKTEAAAKQPRPNGSKTPSNAKKYKKDSAPVNSFSNLPTKQKVRNDAVSACFTRDIIING